MEQESFHNGVAIYFCFVSYPAAKPRFVLTTHSRIAIQFHWWLKFLASDHIIIKWKPCKFTIQRLALFYHIWSPQFAILTGLVLREERLFQNVWLNYQEDRLPIVFKSAENIGSALVNCFNQLGTLKRRIFVFHIPDTWGFLKSATS